MNPILQEYLARCHCEALSARYRTALAPTAWSVRACQCSFCRAHGALTTSDPLGTLEFAPRAPERQRTYRFGSRTAKFVVCAECGVYLGAALESAAGGFGILNIRALRPLPAELPAAQPMDYTGETAEARRERRAASWTPLVLPFL